MKIGCLISTPALAGLLLSTAAAADLYGNGSSFYSIGGDFGIGISADGSTVVGKSSGQAFRWTAPGGMQFLGYLPGANSSEARAVSGDGSRVVGFSGSGAFLWTGSGGMQNLGSLPGRNPGAAAFGISTDGSTVVGNGDGLAFRWTQPTGMQSLGFLSGIQYSYANGISADGSVAVGTAFDSTLNPLAFRWTQASGMQSIGRLPGSGDTVGYAVSADGSVVVGWSGGQAFRWTADGGMQGLGYLPGTSGSKAWAVSADGSTVVGECLTASVDRAFIWDATHGMRDLKTVLQGTGLDLSYWNLAQATGISADGTEIVGNGTGGAWLAVIPEPGTSALLALGALLLARRFGNRPVSTETVETPGAIGEGCSWPPVRRASPATPRGDDWCR